jgi:hypothetical protein
MDGAHAIFAAAEYLTIGKLWISACFRSNRGENSIMHHTALQLFPATRSFISGDQTVAAPCPPRMTLHANLSAQARNRLRRVGVVC